jgi:hypothetical protein
MRSSEFDVNNQKTDGKKHIASFELREQKKEIWCSITVLSMSEQQRYNRV